MWPGFHSKPLTPLTHLLFILPWRVGTVIIPLKGREHQGVEKFINGAQGQIRSEWRTELTLFPLTLTVLTFNLRHPRHAQVIT